MRRTLLVLALASIIALAGCLGGGGDAADTSETGAQDQQQTDTSENATENETDTGPTYVWNETEREGTVTGGSAGSIAFTNEPSTQNVTVRDGTRNLTLNLSTQSNEATMRIAPPGCENTSGSDCTTSVTTEDREAHWNTTDPKVGNWTVSFFRASDGYGEVRYTLTIAKLVPADAPGVDAKGR